MSTSAKETLIDEIRKYEGLYDTNHEKHKDTEYRDICWGEISNKLGLSVEILKHEWKLLRDSFRLVLKKRIKHKKIGAPVRRWKFESKMEFLLPFMTKRSTSSRMRLEISKTSEQASDGEEHVEHANPLESVDVDKPDYCWEKSTTNNNKQDPLELFFSSICQSTKRLPKLLQNRVKRDVLDVVMRAEEEHEMETSPHDDKVNVFANL